MELNEKKYKIILDLCAKGDNYLEKHNYTNAIKLYTKALALVPSPKERWEASTWIYTALGEAHFLNFNYRKALCEFMNAYNCPDGISNPFINLRIGQCFYKINDIDNSKEYLLRAYMLDGDKIFEKEPDIYLNIIKSISSGSNDNINKSKAKYESEKEIDESAMIDRYNELCKCKNYDKAISELENTLNSLSGDKYSHSESYLIIWLILAAAIKSNNISVMEKWGEKILIADPMTEYNGERELWAGKIAYELKQYDKAYDYLKTAYIKSDKGRCFTSKDKKYLDFLNSLK